MAEFRLANLIDMDLFRELPAVNRPETTALWDAGLITTSPLMNDLANNAQKTAELPFWLDLDRDEANLSTDDPAELATPANVVQDEILARKAFINKGWSWMNLANELSAIGTATQRVRERTDAYFVKQFETRLIKSALGVMADNIDNDSSDMTISVASETIAGQTADTRFNSTAFLNAAYTLEDMVGKLGAMVVHSHIMQRMAINNEIVYVPDSAGALTIPTYKGYRVIMSDAIAPVAGTTDGFKYTTILFGANVFGFGQGSPEMPEEIERVGASGNGAGSETLWVRKTNIIHPYGFKVLTTPAKISFSWAELETAAVWDRVIDRKHIPMSFLITN